MSSSSLTRHPFMQVLVYANVYIALCAFSQVLLTQLLFHIPFDFDSISYLVFVPVGTYVQYNMQRGYMISHYNLQTERSVWLHKHKRAMLYSNVIGLVILFCLCNSLSWTSIFIMAGAEIVSSLYYLPPFNFRKYGYIKPFLISAVWVVSCVIIPLVELKADGQLSLAQEEASYYFAAAQFLFIAELCMVFDIKDASADLAGGVRTYANMWGERSTRIFCALLLAGSFVCRWFFSPSLALFSIVLLLATLFVTLKSSDNKHAFWFYIAVDGMLILQLCLVALRMLWYN